MTCRECCCESAAGCTPQQRRCVKQKKGSGFPAAVKFGLKGYRLAAGTSSLFAVFQHMGGLLSRVYSPRRAYMRLPAWTGWGYSKDFPRLAVRPFRAHWGKIEQQVVERSAPPSGKRKILRDLLPLITEQVASRPIHRGTRRPRRALISCFRKGIACQAGGIPGNPRSIDRVLVDDDGAALTSRAFPPFTRPDPTVRVGVTGALAGIAETGSLLLASGAGADLTASLLPEVHVAILKTSRMVPTLADALRLPEVRTAAAGCRHHRSLPHRRYRNDPDHRRPRSGRTARLFD